MKCVTAMSPTAKLIKKKVPIVATEKNFIALNWKNRNDIKHNLYGRNKGRLVVVFSKIGRSAGLSKFEK
jgi:hypothetical protein